MFNKRVIVALDSNDINKTINLVKTLRKDVYAFKIGYEFFFNFGLNGYKKIYSICPKIFLDLKLHDIPNTVKNGLNAMPAMGLCMDCTDAELEASVQYMLDAL